MNREIDRVYNVSYRVKKAKVLWLSNEGRTVNALALGADEGRDEQRYASGSGKYAKIRRFPNGGTQWLKDHYPQGR